MPNPNTISSNKGRFLGTWNLDFDGWRGQLTVRRSTDTANGVTRLGHFLQDGGTTPMAVNGNTIDAGRGLRFSIENSNNPPLTQQNGTMQSVWHGTTSSEFASGRNVWNDTPYGTLLSRSAIPTVPGTFTSDRWVGSWRVVEDGTTAGTLTITSVGAPLNGRRNLTGSFRTTTGTTRSIKATTNPDHVLDLTVNSLLGNRSYTLHAHTRETNVLSGWTQPAGSLEKREAHALRA